MDELCTVVRYAELVSEKVDRAPVMSLVKRTEAGGGRGGEVTGMENREVRSTVN